MMVNYQWCKWLWFRTDQTEQRLGLADKPASSTPAQPAATPASIPSTASPVSESQPSAQLASPATMYEPMDTTPATQSEPTAVPSNDLSPSGTHPSQMLDRGKLSNDVSTSGRTATNQAQTADSSAQLSGSSPAPNVAQASSTSRSAVPAGLDRQIHVFTREAATVAEASNR